MAADLDKPEVFSELAKKLADQDKAWDAKANRIFYLGLPPRMIDPVARQLAQARLNQDRKRSRIVVEKPFGHDLDSARALNRDSGRDLSGIPDLPHRPLPGQRDGPEHPGLPLRQRPLRAHLEPPLHRPRADHGGGGRLASATAARYYEHAGALRDMVQNHLLHHLCLIAMEPPVSFERQ